MPDLTPPALAFEDVSFAYGALSEQKNPTLNNINLRINRGECVCLTGPSGCGKTTLTRLCNGLIPSFYEGSRQGRVLIDGIELGQWEMDELCRSVGSVFQNPRSQFFNLDTTSELAYGCENLGLARAEILRGVAEAVETLGLQDLLERDIHDLSGGQRQLLALGTVCAMGANIFVLDEPTANLDAAATQAVKRTLQRLKDLQKTILIVEHRLHWLDDLVDRVVCMRDGHIARDWTAQEFADLPTDTAAGMGLRRWSLRGLQFESQLRATPGEAGAGSEDAAGASSEDAAGASSEDATDTSSKDAAGASSKNAARDLRPLDIQADGLRAGYRPQEDILKGLSFLATGGHAVAIIGGNGQGKSTLAQVMAGLIRESYGGISLNARPLSARSRIGSVYLVLQESGYQLFGASVREEFEIGLASPDAGDQAQIADLIQRFGLSGREERHPASLSGGEKQRLAVAVGVHAGARLLVLDEPTSGLDRANMRRCADEIRRLVQLGCCVFVITHDAELVAAACDQVIEVADGRVRSAYDLSDETLPRALGVLAPGYADDDVMAAANAPPREAAFGIARQASLGIAR
ncbi:MAG: ABC transporter ATP-binding protein [Coriobacteriales bacterium]|jgi:energy-coupling factor transport system ATP-binding protein|nr:ABC transporter ATP-binding protein [Coriobacteriales bacterium]